MVTIFSTPRPFKGEFKSLQENAIKSWLNSCPNCEIILIEDEERTTASVAKNLNVKLLKGIKKNSAGVYFLDDVFNKIKKRAKQPILAHVNTDIILTKSFFKAVEKLNQKYNEFYMVGKRWNLDVKAKVKYSPNWEKKLLKKVEEKGELHPPTGIDYWVFPKHINWDLPPFLVGRPAADNWLIYQARKKRIPVIDATEAVDIIHQNHSRPFGNPDYVDERKHNQDLYKKHSDNVHLDNYYFDVTDADFKLDSSFSLSSNSNQIFKKFIYSRYAPSVLNDQDNLWKVTGVVINPVLDQLIKFVR